MEAVETRVAVIAIIVREGTQVAALNDLLHQYGPYIVGRMGVPYREKGVNIISVAMDAPGDVISALSGKLGRPCRIVNGKKKGRFELEFYGQDDLQNLLDALMNLKK